MKPQRMFSLDVLRGIACLLVIGAHIPTHYPEVKETVDAYAAPLAKCGFLGVDLFFVLSGLLISGLLFKELQSSGTLGLRRFWLRRGMKIWPAYYVTYLTLVVYRLFMFNRIQDWTQLRQTYQSIVPNGLFFQNYADCWQWPCSWSVAVEEHFYLLLPLLLLALASRGKLHWLPGVFLGTAAVDLALRVGMAMTGSSWEAIRYPSHLHVDALLFGVLLGYGFAYYPAHMERWRKWWPVGIVASVVLVAGASIVPLPIYPLAFAISFTVAYLAFGLLVLSARQYPQFGATGPWILRAPCAFLAWVGVYSYTIYLTHGVTFVIPYPRLVMSWFSHPAWAPSVFVVGSIASGVLVSHLVERPMLLLRDWWIPSARKTSPTTESGASEIEKAALPRPWFQRHKKHAGVSGA